MARKGGRDDNAVPGEHLPFRSRRSAPWWLPLRVRRFAVAATFRLWRAYQRRVRCSACGVYSSGALLNNACNALARCCFRCSPGLAPSPNDRLLLRTRRNATASGKTPAASAPAVSVTRAENLERTSQRRLYAAAPLLQRSPSLTFAMQTLNVWRLCRAFAPPALGVRDACYGGERRRRRGLHFTGAAVLRGRSRCASATPGWAWPGIDGPASLWRACLKNDILAPRMPFMAPS